jgi:predicted protein tyrosine phosphatase
VPHKSKPDTDVTALGDTPLYWFCATLLPVSKERLPRAKKWKEIYTRSEKVARARKLGFEYPRDKLDGEGEYAARKGGALRSAAIERLQGLPETAPAKLLFVCSKNQWRSPTAERVLGALGRFQTRSAGTSQGARHPVTREDIAWADAILAMEEKHSQRLRAEFSRALLGKPLCVLDIPDEYKYMDADLVDILLQTTADALTLLAT